LQGEKNKMEHIDYTKKEQPKFKKREIEYNIIELIKSNIIKRDADRFILDYNKLSEESIELTNYFDESPGEFIKRLVNSLNEEFDGKFPIFIEGLSVEDKISEIRAKDIGKMVCIKGMISKSTKPLTLVENRSWECFSCGSIITTPFAPPEKCSCGKRGKMKMVKEKLLDLQEIELEELQDDLRGRQPARIRIRLMEHLTSPELSGIIQPGGKVKIIGIVKNIPLKTSSDEEIMEFRIFALGIEDLEDNYEDSLLDDEELIRIQEIAALKPLETLKDAIAPNICGYDDIKRALVLQQVFGVKRDKSNGKTRRDKSHILLVGDAGLGKTTFAINVKMRSPKSYYITGEQASSVGITASVEKDQLTGTWSLKAGVLPRANGGIAIIDELDKAGDKERNALHTPMELGLIPVNKAGINVTLNADCGILALANPKNSMFERGFGKTLVQQIDLSPTLLNRFDLIFIIKDNVNEQRDENIVKSLFKKEENTLIDVKLFRKYINYVRKLTPELSPELEQEAIKFYSDVRKKSMVGDNLKGMPINPRFLEGLFRLSEAHAKLRLSEKVELEDLEIAKKLMYNTLLELGLDEYGILDTARINGGKTQSMKNKIDTIMKIIKKVDGELSESELIKILSENNIGTVDSYNLLETLSREGLILKQNGAIKLI